MNMVSVAAAAAAPVMAYALHKWGFDPARRWAWRHRRTSRFARFWLRGTDGKDSRGLPLGIYGDDWRDVR